MLSFLRRKDAAPARGPAVSLTAGRAFVNLGANNRRRTARFIQVVIHARFAVLNPRVAGVKSDKHMAEIMANLDHAIGTLKIHGIEVPTDPVQAEALRNQFMVG